jgi:hypothetical protein
VTEPQSILETLEATTAPSPSLYEDAPTATAEGGAREQLVMALVAFRRRGAALDPTVREVPPGARRTDAAFKDRATGNLRADQRHDLDVKQLAEVGRGQVGRRRSRRRAAGLSPPLPRNVIRTDQLGEEVQ